MPLLRNGNQQVVDVWRRLDDEDNLPTEYSGAGTGVQDNGGDQGSRLTEGGPSEKVESNGKSGESAVDGSTAPLAVSLPRYLDLAASRGGVQGIAGVWLTPTDDVDLLAPHVHRLQLIMIGFPLYTDGRGYSQARTLRARLGYGGELRAIGDVRPDQLLFMIRAGIDTFDLAEAVDDALLQGLVGRYETSYQPSYALAIAG